MQNDGIFIIIFSGFLWNVNFWIKNPASLDLPMPEKGVEIKCPIRLMIWYIYDLSKKKNWKQWKKISLHFAFLLTKSCVNRNMNASSKKSWLTKRVKKSDFPQKIKSCIWYEMCFQKLSEILKRLGNIIVNPAIMHGFTFQAFGS